MAYNFTKSVPTMLKIAQIQGNKPCVHGPPQFVNQYTPGKGACHSRYKRLWHGAWQYLNGQVKPNSLWCGIEFVWAEGSAFISLYPSICKQINLFLCRIPKTWRISYAYAYFWHIRIAELTMKMRCLFSIKQQPLQLLPTLKSKQSKQSICFGALS